MSNANGEAAARAALDWSREHDKKEIEFAAPTILLLRDFMRTEVSAGLADRIDTLLNTKDGQEKLAAIGAHLFAGARDAARSEVKEFTFKSILKAANVALWVIVIAGMLFPIFGVSGFKLAWKIVTS